MLAKLPTVVDKPLHQLSLHNRKGDRCCISTAFFAAESRHVWFVTRDSRRIGCWEIGSAEATFPLKDAQFTAEEVAALYGRPSAFGAVAEIGYSKFSLLSSGERLVIATSGSPDVSVWVSHQIEVWDCKSKGRTHTIVPGGRIADILPCVDADRFVCLFESEKQDHLQIGMWESESGACAWTVTTENSRLDQQFLTAISATTFAIHALVSDSCPSCIFLFDLRTGQKTGTRVDPRLESLSALCFGDAGGLLTAQVDGVIRAWNATADGSVVLELQLTDRMHSIGRMQVRGGLLLATGWGIPVQVWDLTSAALLFQSADASYYRCAFSADGHWLLAVGHQRLIQVWPFFRRDSLRDRCLQTVATLQLPLPDDLPLHLQPRWQMLIAPR